jgi:hypothetical protein
VLDGPVMWGGWTGGAEEKDKLVFGVIVGSHLYLPGRSQFTHRQRCLRISDVQLECSYLVRKSR